ncbi:MAG: restriction endonuclease subunit S [Prevotella sp.]|nr:restriction endonuclease subunit S [Prevotella sp.]
MKKEIKEGWKIKTFESCLEKVMPPIKLQSKCFKEKGAYPIVSQEDKLISGYQDNEEYLVKHNKPIVIFGDHTRVVKYIDFDFIVGADGVKLLLPKDFLDSKFLYYFVVNANIKNLGYARHYRLLKELNIPLPPLSEQQRIVSLLDQEFAKIDAIRENAEKNLQNAKDLFQATLNKELSQKEEWKLLSIKDIASLKAGKFVSAKDISSINDKKSYPCYGGNGFRGYVKSYNHDGEYNIIGRQGALCGNINIARGKFHATEHAVVVTPKIPIEFMFLNYSLINANLNQYSTGAAQPGLSVDNLMNKVVLPIPTIEEQKVVIAKIEITQAICQQLETNCTSIITNCQSLKQSLLRKAFNGEL